MTAQPAFILLFALLFACRTQAAPSEKPLLNGLFTDHMVLQRDRPCPVWGWAEPGSTVTVAFAGQTRTAAADGAGRWQLTLEPLPAAAEPRELAVTTTGAAPVTLRNVLVGDVWLCSGQSNMDMGIDGVNQWWNELPGAAVNGVRLYWVKPTSSFAPESTVAGAWSVCTSEALLKKKQPFTSVGFSAIAWFFGREIHKQTGVPIGLIEAAQGNTSIQPWSALASLRQDPKYGATLDPFAYYEQQIGKWAQANDPAYAKTEAWRALDFNDSDWAEIDLPQEWGKHALPGFAGLVWFRRQVALPVDWQGHDVELDFGPVEEQETTWFNGVFVGGQDGYRRNHRFHVPGTLVKAGTNLIAVRVLGRKGFIGKPEQLTLCRKDGAGDAVPLAGLWKVRASTPAGELATRKRQFDRIWVPGGLYHGMIAPLAPFGIKGMLWYQGEGNAGQIEYERDLTALIRDWRATFGQGDIPFYIVQLAGFGPLPAAPVDSSWALTRELQARVARSVTNCGLAVAIDRGEIYDIHPPNKRDVGLRLAAVALARTYGQNVPCEGPTFKAMQVEGERIRVTFEHAAGLKSLGAAPTGFAIAGSDRKFVWAQAWLDGETVVVSAPEVNEPVAVRYAWSDNAVCNLYNGAKLPAVPFRTDTW